MECTETNEMRDGIWLKIKENTLNKEIENTKSFSVSQIMLRMEWGVFPFLAFNVFQPKRNWKWNGNETHLGVRGRVQRNTESLYVYVYKAISKSKKKMKIKTN